MELSYSHVTVYIAFLCIAAVPVADSLECYACDNQDSNTDKCLKTTKQCEEHQDSCMTIIRWGLPPSWSVNGDRVHYINKECSVRTECDAQKKERSLYCKRDWYDDWECTECCSGDLCNYYVTLTGSTHICSFTTVCVSLLIFILAVI